MNNYGRCIVSLHGPNRFISIHHTPNYSAIAYRTQWISADDKITTMQISP